MFYEIIIESLLPERMKDYFEPMIIMTKNNYTIITGEVIDQSALFGVIATIRDLNLLLVSINRK